MYLRAHLAKIDAVSRTEADFQLRNSLSDRFNIAQIPVFDTIEATEDNRLGLRIKSSEPLCERLPAILILTNQNFSRNRFHAFSQTALV